MSKDMWVQFSIKKDCHGPYANNKTIEEAFVDVKNYLEEKGFDRTDIFGTVEELRVDMPVYGNFSADDIIELLNIKFPGFTFKG